MFRLGKSWLDRFVQAYEDGEYYKMVLSVLGLLLFLALLVLGFLGVMWILWNLREILVPAGIAVAIIIVAVKDWQKKTEIMATAISEEEKARIKPRAEYTRKILLPMMFDLIKLKAELVKLDTPKSRNDIKCHSPFTPVAKGTEPNKGQVLWVMYHFNVDKSEMRDYKEEERSMIRKVLQNSLSQMCSDGEFREFSAPLKSAGGVFYEPLVIDSVRDGDTHLQINVVVNNDNYLKALDAFDRGELEMSLETREETI